MNNRAQIYLKKGKEESLLRRHPWIFSGAIERAEVDEELTEGEIVDVRTKDGNFIASGHYQIGSIAIRVLTFEQEQIDQQWWNRRVEAAYEVREALKLTESEETTCYRLIHGEGDSLPGLVVDIYGSHAVVQCHSVGMYLSRREVAEAIRATYAERITTIYDKSAQTLPYNADLGAVDGYLYGGSASPSQSNIVLEGGHKFSINWERGQKTGFFIDQRYNRELVQHYAKGRTVLNTFCYTGGFSVYALAGGAKEVCSVDSSQRAVELADENVRLNFGEGAAHTSVAVDAMEYLKDIGSKYDLVILDPPAFAKHHKVVGKAMQGYKRLNARALSQIKSGGILFTFSCSQAVSKELFRTTVFSAAAIAGRKVRILHQLTQPADHPINIYHPEGEYLKGLVLYVE
ncbi:MAG: class I SAM-dependent rRNA methyltransferase [Rikenellaceae bacterium]